MFSMGDIIELHAKIAKRYKQFETTDGEIPPLVVLNEMRYALRAMIKIFALASFNDLDQKQQHDLDTALQECHHALRNAYHDLVDGILIQTSKMMDGVLEKYPVAAVKMLGEKRLEILETLNEVERHVAKSRSEGQKRQEIYDIEIYDKWFEKLVSHYQLVDQQILPSIIKEHDRLQKKEASKKRKFCLTVLLSILSICTMAALGILRLFSPNS